MKSTIGIHDGWVGRKERWAFVVLLHMRKVGVLPPRPLLALLDPGHSLSHMGPVTVLDASLFFYSRYPQVPLRKLSNPRISQPVMGGGKGGGGGGKGRGVQGQSTATLVDYWPDRHGLVLPLSAMHRGPLLLLVSAIINLLHAVRVDSGSYSTIWI